MRLMCLTTIVLATLAVPVLSSSPAKAEVVYPWCASYGGRDGPSGTNCGFVNWAQCMATVSGIGGWCEPNPRYANPPPRRRR